MNVVAIVEALPPRWNAGGEITMHLMLRELKRRGHGVVALVTGANHEDSLVVHEDVLQVGVRHASYDFLIESARNADVLVTQLRATGEAMRVADRAEKPLVHYAHVPWHCKRYRIPDDATVVFNSEWTKREARREGRVAYPPVFPQEYAVSPGESFTLLNMTSNKGGEVFWRLAKAEPKLLFLGVEGAYGVQTNPGRTAHRFENVSVVPSSPDVRAIYRRTRCVLVPSGYESYGRAPLEAAASGIPSVCRDLPGIREAMGGAPIYVPDLDAASWVAALREVNHNWGQYAHRALDRSREVDPRRGVDVFEEVLLSRA